MHLVVRTARSSQSRARSCCYGIARSPARQTPPPDLQCGSTVSRGRASSRVGECSTTRRYRRPRTRCSYTDPRGLNDFASLGGQLEEKAGTFVGPLGCAHGPGPNTAKLAGPLRRCRGRKSGPGWPGYWCAARGTNVHPGSACVPGSGVRRDPKPHNRHMDRAGAGDSSPTNLPRLPRPPYRAGIRNRHPANSRL